MNEAKNSSRIPPDAVGFLRANFFSLINLVVLLTGFAYGYGVLQASVGSQNTAIQETRAEVKGLPEIKLEGMQNSADIARLKASESAVRAKLDSISDQISRLGQWMRDHPGGPK